MTPRHVIIKQRIQAQGFCGLDDKTYQQLNYPLRLSPAICMLWAALGTYLSSPLILWLLVPFAALGAILPGHPFDTLYNYGLRKISNTPRIPTYPARRRFACVMATVMIIIAAWGFQAGYPLLGQIMGWSLVAAAFVNVSTGFCVPSFIARLIIGKSKCVTAINPQNF
ncbi:MAG: DUF4395 domain-containing protein [Gammaproteobacteria bacterium]|nr:DUF4395 domain-containing protein [Gammaproteobacteria bacterium]